MNDAVTLEQARKLAALEYVGEFPQVVLARAGKQLEASGEWVERWRYRYVEHLLELTSMAGTVIEHIPAPSVMQALVWLQERGWYYGKIAATHQPQWWAATQEEQWNCPGHLWADTAAELLDAILTEES